MLTPPTRLSEEKRVSKKLNKPRFSQLCFKCRIPPPPPNLFSCVFNWRKRDPAYRLMRVNQWDVTLICSPPPTPFPDLVALKLFEGISTQGWITSNHYMKVFKWAEGWKRSRYPFQDRFRGLWARKNIARLVLLTAKCHTYEGLYLF